MYMQQWSGDWSIFRREDAFCEQTVDRKQNMDLSASRGARGIVPCEPAKPEETLQPTQPLGTIAITRAEPWGYLAESAETPVAVFRGSGKIG
jgi:hypothetical protein